ncbi:MAG: creatininase family protein [Gemmatimonadota bacterium]
MEPAAGSLLLTTLTSTQVRARIERDPRLLVPIGACDQYGPHLPLGAATLVAEKFAEQLSTDFQVLRAPTLAYGVNVPVEGNFAGRATLREKTFHAVLNDLLASWEDEGVREFILLTVHNFDAHVEAAATVTTAVARVRVFEVLNIDLSAILEGESGPEHGGEMLTSLMLHLYPELVRMERASDFVPENRSISTLRRLPRIPTGSPGSLGQPTLGAAEKGRRLYEYVYEKIRNRVFEEGD